MGIPLTGFVLARQGVIAWAAIAKFPDMFEKAVIINAPHASAFWKAPISQVLKSWYIRTLAARTCCPC